MILKIIATVLSSLIIFLGIIGVTTSKRLDAVSRCIYSLILIAPIISILAIWL